MYTKGSIDSSSVLIKGALEIGPYPIGQADHEAVMCCCVCVLPCVTPWEIDWGW